MLDSILAQTYRNWEVCVARRKPEGRGRYCEPRHEQSTRGKDSRCACIRVWADNRGISGNTNAALEMARGDFIILADHDDTIPEHALYEVREGHQ